MEETSAAKHVDEKFVVRTNPHTNAQLAYTTIVLSLCSFTFGMNLGYFNALRPVFSLDKQNQNAFSISNFQWSIAVTILFLSALISNICVSYIRKDKKYILIGNNFLYLLGNISILFARSPIYLIFGRFLIGIGCGTTCALIPLYMQKIAPKNKKGIFGSIHQLSLCLGIFVATIYSFYFCSSNTWKLGLVLTTVILSIHTFLLFFIINNEECSNANSAPLFSVFLIRNARLSIITSIIMHAGQQATGIRAVIIFSNSIFKENRHSKLCCALIGFNLVLGTLISMFIVDRFGRKPMILFSLFLSGVSLIFLSFKINDILGIFGFILGYSIGMGPIPWFITGEVFPEKYKKAGTVIGVSANWLSSFFVTVTFSYAFEWWSNKCFLSFFIFSAFIAAFVLLFLKETKGRKSDFI